MSAPVSASISPSVAPGTDDLTTNFEILKSFAFIHWFSSTVVDIYKNGMKAKIPKIGKFESAIYCVQDWVDFNRCLK